jgi:hypothetical protein
MAFPDFLSKKKKDKKGKAFEPNVFKEKCLKVLSQIKLINEDKYQKLNRIFNTQYDKANIQKKKIQGFYGQLINELKSLQGNAQERLYATGQELVKKAEKTAKKNPKAKAAIKKVAKAVDKVTKTEPPKKTKKKAVKKTPAKETKKVVKKTAKKVAKKTEKKVTKASAVKKTKATKAKKKTKKKT